jgi:hypothetical protein
MRAYLNFSTLALCVLQILTVAITLTQCMTQQELRVIQEFNQQWPDIVYPNDGNLSSTECKNWVREYIPKDTDNIVICGNNHPIMLNFDNIPNLYGTIPENIGDLINLVYLFVIF